MRIIDLETHCQTQSYVDHLLGRTELPRLEIAEVNGRKQRMMRSSPTSVQNHEWSLKDLLDLDKNRFVEMDEAGVTTQVLTLSLPGCELFEPVEGTAAARKVNNEVAALMKRYPGRFIGLANLAPQAPEAAADELERAVTELGFKGGNVNSHVRGGEYLDEKKYRVFWERAAKLDVPVYLHPRPPSPQMIEPFLAYGVELKDAALGYGVETSLHAMRLVWSGLFDEYPNLKVILGHMGEALPFWLYRIDGSAKRQHSKSLQHKPSEYIRNNFVVTISGMPFAPAFMCIYLALGADRILFASDHPYGNMKEMVDFMNGLPICAEDKEKIFHTNAERLLKLA